MKQFWFAAILIAAPLAAQPIGRSGNGRMASVEDGFSSALPSQLPYIEESANGALRCSNPAVRDSFGHDPRVVIHRFSVVDTARAALSRDSLRLDLLNNDWQVSPFSSDACVDVYVRDQGSVMAMLATWGNGRGIEVIGDRNSFTQNAVSEIATTLQLTPGACAWK